MRRLVSRRPEQLRQFTFSPSGRWWGICLPLGEGRIILQTMNRKRNAQGQAVGAAGRGRQLWHPDVPGPLWDGSRRVGFRQIEAYCGVLAREFQPERIILFGSYASGTASGHSDVDLIVVMPYRGSATEQVVRIRGLAEAPFPMDLLVRKPGEMRRQDSLTRAVLSEGRVMWPLTFTRAKR